MSEPTTPAAALAEAKEPEAIELPHDGDAAFSALMDALAPSTDKPEDKAGTAPAAVAPAANGQPAAAGEGTAPAAGTATAPAAGDAGKPPVAPGTPAAAPAAGDAAPAPPVAGSGGAATAAPAGDLDALTLAPKWGEISTALEDKVLDVYREEAYDAVKEEYGKYFEALELHPRQLIGQTVPRIGAEGDETLRDSADAAEWQEAVKQVLTGEIRDRASRLIDDGAPALESIHAAIELFQKNADLVPGTKQFDRELADNFAQFAKPYEVRVDGKLRGYNIPTQPLIDQLRTQLVARRQTAAKVPDMPAAVPPAVAPAASTPVVEPPQAGIPAKAGEGSNAEDFSALFGTIGLPNLRI